MNGTVLSEAEVAFLRKLVGSLVNILGFKDINAFKNSIPPEDANVLTKLQVTSDDLY